MSREANLIKPDFIVIGAMKSATSSLAEQLNLQPGVFMTDIKEPNFFSNDEIYEKGEAWYSSLFADAKTTDLKGEASTHYTKLPKYPDTLVRLRDYCPDAKFIYVMRHPIDRLVSHFAHNWTTGHFKRNTSIDAAIVEYPPLVEYGLYKKQLDPWFKAFGLKRVLPVFFDRLISEPQKELERISKFIGITDDVSWKQEQGKNLSTNRYRRLPFQELVVESAFFTALRRSLIPKSLRDLIRQSRSSGLNAELSSESIDFLTDKFDEDLSELGDLLGVELNCENFIELTRSCSLNWDIDKIS